MAELLLEGKGTMEQHPRRFEGATWKCAVQGIAPLAVVLAAGSSPALDIVMNFSSSQTANPAPSFDPNNLLLPALMANVETYYEDIFEEPGTLTISYYYADLGDTTLAD